MRRPAFSVVSGAVTVLVIIGFVSRILLPRIPKPVENSLAGDSSQFLSRASVQRIDWKRPVPEAFAEARRLDKPIFLFIGTSSNPFARDLDNGVLMSPQVQAYLARNFLCIRVDAVAYPEFRSAYLPITRTILGLLPGFQIWILDPSGDLIDMVPRNLALYGTDESGFVGALVKARRMFEDSGERRGQTDFNAAQDQDLAQLTSFGAVLPPSFDQFASTLFRSIDSVNGGFRNAGFKSVTPETWRFLLLSGNAEAFHDSFDPVLKTPIVDVLDGGFFGVSRSDDWTAVEFDKTAMSNAAMLRLLVEAWGIRQDDFYKWLAQRTFDCLANELTKDGVVYACRIGDSDESGRSDRSSFGVRKLREILPDELDHTWAQLKLGLVVETNPRMSPRITDPRIIRTHPDRLEDILHKLRRDTGPRPDRVGGGYADITGFTVARLIEAARILGDRPRMDQALALFDRLSALRTGDDIIHADISGQRNSYVGDYLAYADACLQHYLATGRFSSLQDGKTILNRALFLFSGSEMGVLNTVVARPKPMPDDLKAPELADTASESTIAQSIRLCHAYARVLADSDAGLASKFRKFANGAAFGYGIPASKLGNAAAGFFCAASSIFDDAFIVTCGARAQADGDWLAARLPTRLVVPAFGEVRTDIQKKGPGVYLVRGAEVEGPMTAAQAAKMLSPYLSLSAGS